MALIASALTTVENARSHLNIPSADTTQTLRLELLINAATARMESMTERLLKTREITELRSGRRNNIITLRQWPVTAVSSLRIDSSSQFGAETEASNYQIVDEQTGIQLINNVYPSGNNNIRVVYTAGYNASNHEANLAELELTCLWLVEWFYRHRERGDMGRTAKSKGDESVGILAEMPTMIREIIQDYKRCEAPLLDKPMVNL